MPSFFLFLAALEISSTLQLRGIYFFILCLETQQGVVLELSLWSKTYNNLKSCNNKVPLFFQFLAMLLVSALQSLNTLGPLVADFKNSQTRPCAFGQGSIQRSLIKISRYSRPLIWLQPRIAQHPYPMLKRKRECPRFAWALIIFFRKK